MSEEQDIQRSERIHAYVHDHMDERERARFEQELASDADLRSEVEAARALDAALGQERELRFRKLVGAVSDRLEEAGGGAVDETPVIPIGRRNNLRWMAAAASVLVILGVSVWVLTDRIGGQDHRALAMAELERPLSTMRSGGDIADQLDSLHQEATKRLLGGQWQELLTYTEALLGSEAFYASYGDRTRLDRAWALLQLERPAEARKELSAVRSADPALAAERAYDLALSHLLEDDAPAARRALEGVEAPFPWDERIARLREGLAR